MATLVSTFHLIIVMSTLIGLPIFGESRNFLGASQTSETDAETSLASELANAVDKNRLMELEEALRLTYTALPKNADGNLGHKAVRYVLHRLFVQRHGWYVKGLEPNSDVQHDSLSDASFTEWVPSYLQERLEQLTGDHGLSLSQLAAFAATLEDLIYKEAIAQLRMAYEIHRFPIDGAITREELGQVIETYYVSFLQEKNFSATGPQDVEDEKAIFAKEYTGWPEAKEWLVETLGHTRVPDNAEKFNFSMATRMALRIGEEYHKFNDLECKDLKQQLQQIEGQRPGRVRLSAFYNKGLYSHWRFNEKADYLRTLGALDESDASQPQVILPNYLMARTNCLEASSFYALCCQNECEDLMGHLEQKIGAPEASVDQIIELVATLASASVGAPRNLSAALVGRLTQVAEKNYGVVPIHGRLFAQFMSHAYPRECPYPHEAGTTSPQTPDEWMRSTGQESSKASTEEMMKQVESDTCAFDDSNAGSDCGKENEQSTELPWSNSEELLVVSTSSQQPLDKPRGSCMSTIKVFLAATAIALAFVLAVDKYYSSHQHSGLLNNESAIALSLEHSGLNLQAVLAFMSLSSAACALELFDVRIFVIGLCAGLLTLVVRFSKLRATAHCKDAKSCV